MFQRRLALALALVAASPCVLADRVQVTTPLGTFFIDLLEEEAPATVANFLNYVNDGDFDNAFFHRSINGFVIQGGGFNFISGEVGDVPADPPVINEFGRSNVRGTVAMAKLGGDPNSATSQWFINLVDNSAVLDPQNGGFTVFGVVEGDGMSVVDTIMSQASVQNFGGVFSTLPVINYDGVSALATENFVFTDISVAQDSGFEIKPGVASSWFDPQTAGQGWFVDVIENTDGTLQLFVSWFTYANDEPPADEDLSFGTSQHRWFTASGPVDGASATMELFQNSGGRFNDPRDTQSQRVGTLSMTFQSCNEATLTYSFDSGPGGAGEIDVVNLTPDSVCQ